jgi:hypothetical protein
LGGCRNDFALLPGHYSRHRQNRTKDEGESSRRDQYARPMIVGARLQVDPQQAKIRKIVALYAGGLSIKTTTKKLNSA